MRIEASFPAVFAKPAAPAVRAVAPQRTPTTVSDIRAALSRAHVRVAGRPASPDLLDTLTAQVSLETARGDRMYNYNFGGIKGASPAGTTAACMTHEVIDGKDVTVRQDFRAYESLDQGADDYVKVMRTRFSAALAPAERGDLEGYAHALKQARYYTAREGDYAAALRANAGTSAPRPPPARALPPDETYPSTLGLARVLDALAVSSARIAAPEDGSS